MLCGRNRFYDEMGQWDKRLHMQYSAGILLALSVVLPFGLALSLTFLIGLGKEVWDHYYGSGFCWFDMAANLIGMGFVIPSVLLCYQLF